MSIRRSAERRTWTTIDNRTIEDSRLSFGALGMLTYILSKPDNWTIRTADMLKRGGIKRPTYVKWLAELEAAGYASLERTQGERGRFAGTTWVVAESPSDRDTVSPNLGQGQPIVMTDVLVMTETAVKTDTIPAPVGAMVKASPSATIDANPWNTVIRRIADRLGIVGDGELVKTRAKEMQLQAWVGKLLAQVGRHAGGDKDKALFLVDQWADSKAFYFRGNNRSNWADAFNKWMMDDGPRQTVTILPSSGPPGAPPDWRELVYTHDGTRRAPALILPRIGLDRFAPAAAWPAWLRELEGIAV